jgi:DNA polymerase III subunit gamma/tau
MNENYRALTRKYRPQAFEDIVSQEHVSNTLKNAIRNNRLSHAYMFCGPRGVGKTTMARVLARAVNEVAANVDGEALGRTLNIVEMDAASNRKIEDVRSLKEVIRVPPQNGKYKIFIIDEVHMLTKEAFNALLKTLEEPPPHAIFIFATTEPHKVLPTILSRVQRFDFKRISVGEIVERLRSIAQEESIQIDEESLHVIAKRADGALRDALGLMDQAIAFCGSAIGYNELLRALNVVDKEHLFSFMEAVKEKDSHAGLVLIRDLLQAGTDIQEFLVTMTEHIRNLYVAHSSKRLHLVEATGETKQRYLSQAEDFSEEDLMRVLHLVSETQHKLKEVRQPRVHFEILMLKLIHMSRSVELDRLIGELEELKKKSGNGHLNEMRDENLEEPAPGTGNTLTSAETPAAGEGSQAEASAEVAAAENPGEDEPASNVDEKVSEPPADDEEEDIFGIPSLGKTEDVKKVQESATGATLSGQTREKEPEKKINGLHDVTGRWSKFLDNLKENSPKTLYYQMQRVEPRELNGRELTIAVDNEFARQLVDENRMMLAKTLKEEIGISLQLSCIVERDTKQTQETLSPYERFKELQKKDPQIRTIVELFGAELEY